MTSLSKVEARNAQGTVLSLPLSDYSNGLLVQEIDGLDPVKSTTVYSSLATSDDNQYQASRREPRSIMIKLGLEAFGDTTVRDLRTQLMNIFMPKSEVTLRFYTDDFGALEIVGRVETFDAPMFTQDPVASIGLLCLNSDFYNPESVKFNGVTTASGPGNAVYYDGNIETGIVLRMPITRNLDEFVIEHLPPDNVLRRFEFSAPGILETGDILEISTISGAKRVSIIRDFVDVVPFLDAANPIPGKVWDPCKYEDGPGPCVWDGTVLGNGKGDSFYIKVIGHPTKDSDTVRINHWTAKTMRGQIEPKVWPACENEDGPGACVWDASKKGNGQGQSFYINSQAQTIAISNDTAKAMLGEITGEPDSILYGVAPDASWINLYPGTNHIRVYAEGAGIPYTIEYNDKIGGL